MENKPKIMIVDDAEINRQLLMSILGEDYTYIEAEDGHQALHLLQKDLSIDLMLLDINMPKMDGFQVLERMNRFHWISEIPVIMISSEEKKDVIERAYLFGAQDYIRRPFDTFIVRRRVQNTLNLYINQKRLKQMVSDQIYEKEENNNLMIGILSHVVEFRNSESGEHILHIRTITELLLRQIVKKTDEYHLSEADIAMITAASALHDIGKISIPEEILNKPGKLTPEEFNTIKQHTTIGADIIKQMYAGQEKPLLQLAWQICRWHHERWDGRGYPDGLLGESIPISAQVVALADVYDALTSKRCYKDAFDHEKALEMILAGECGAFNPFLLSCLRDIAPKLRGIAPDRPEEEVYRHEADRLATEMMKKEKIGHSDRAQHMLNAMQERADFFASLCGGLQFDYNAISKQANIVNYNEFPHCRHSVLNMEDTVTLNRISQRDLHRIKEALAATTLENKEFTLNIMLDLDGQFEWCDLHVHTLWSDLSPENYVGIIGQIQEPTKTMASLPILDGNMMENHAKGEELQRSLSELKQIFDVVRLVDPAAGVELMLDENGLIRRTDRKCADFLGNSGSCANCISKRALAQKTSLNKMEFVRNNMYYVSAKYMCINGTPCVLEMLSKMKEGRWIDANGTRFLLDEHRGETRELFSDPLTGAYSRRYFETYISHLEGMECVEIIDVDQFKQVNDTYGHTAGDVVLRDIVAAIQSCIRTTDILIRYGGDEFLLLFPKISEENLSVKNARIRETVKQIVIPEYPGLKLSVSIGGVCGVHPIKEAIRQADEQMYRNKKKA